jgi:hypothetical protein
MDVQVLGTCSLCAGRVIVPRLWWSVVAPIPTCERCCAVVRNYGTIEMGPPQTMTIKTIHPKAPDGN